MLRMAAAAALLAVFLTGETDVKDADAATLTSAAPIAIFEAVESRVALTLAERAGGLIEVAATVTPADGQVRTVRLQMYDGESVTVAMPGGAATSFELNRKGEKIFARMRG